MNTSRRRRLASPRGRGVVSPASRADVPRGRDDGFESFGGESDACPTIGGARKCPSRSSSATLSVHTKDTPRLTCSAASARTSFSFPYVPRSNPRARTSSAASGRSPRARTLTMSPQSLPSTATRIAASRESRLGSAWPGRQLVMSITGYRDCNRRMPNAASGSNEEKSTRRSGCAAHSANTARSSARFASAPRSSPSSNLSSTQKPNRRGASRKISSSVAAGASRDITHGSGSGADRAPYPTGNSR